MFGILSSGLTLLIGDGLRRSFRNVVTLCAAVAACGITFVLAHRAPDAPMFFAWLAVLPALVAWKRLRAGWDDDFEGLVEL